MCASHTVRSNGQPSDIDNWQRIIERALAAQEVTTHGSTTVQSSSTGLVKTHRGAVGACVASAQHVDCHANAHCGWPAGHSRQLAAAYRLGQGTAEACVVVAVTHHRHVHTDGSEEGEGGTVLAADTARLQCKSKSAFAHNYVLYSLVMGCFDTAEAHSVHATRYYCIAAVPTTTRPTYIHVSRYLHPRLQSHRHGNSASCSTAMSNKQPIAHLASCQERASRHVIHSAAQPLHIRSRISITQISWPRSSRGKHSHDWSWGRAPCHGRCGCGCG